MAPLSQVIQGQTRRFQFASKLRGDIMPLTPLSRICLTEYKITYFYCDIQTVIPF